MTGDPLLDRYLPVSVLFLCVGFLGAFVLGAYGDRGLGYRVVGSLCIAAGLTGWLWNGLTFLAWTR